jgi:hypothetical protein
MAETEVRQCRWWGSETECDCVKRITCFKLGDVGHKMCGWCFTHDRPMFHCNPNRCGWPDKKRNRKKKSEMK